MQIVVYRWYGQPEGFYFRNVTEPLFVISTGGAILGVPFGVLLLLSLWLTGRRAQPFATLVRALFIIALVALAITVVEFQARKLYSLLHEGIALLVAFATTMYCSVPIKKANAG